ncbi:FecR family protein [Cyanobium sp. Morenito 9A2]|uniref:FecR family protein n=1 Tax=Cyanobium sp. Morenito 9A2 TaxID=2823718 RepID=UPI0020CC31DD|nr:FecR family protein [Cyanobium sp. Morenito 9A2]MCP9850371.1 hypothetical protein [Cyanobium sp. Morenito 9A2]
MASLRALVPVLALLWAVPTVAAPSTAPASTATSSTATVQEILDGRQVAIDERQVRVGARAHSPQQVSTGDSRAQLAFSSGAAGRLNRFSRLRLGSDCFLLGAGQVLVSGKQNACTRSSRLSVRGTNYVLDLLTFGELELSVLEGTVAVQSLRDGVPTGEPPVAVESGQRVRLSASGALLSRQLLSAAALREILEGPLVQGFRSPLPDGEALARLTRSLASSIPAAPGPTAAVPPSDPLLDLVNGTRAGGGRAPFQSLPVTLASANSAYAEPVLRQLIASGSCDHDLGAWQAFQARSASGSFRPVSEVLGCPVPSGRWNPERVLKLWLSSSHHTDILLNRPRTSHAACLQLSEGGRTGALCTFWVPATSP